jgi:uroporphyrinogen-III synthase
MRVLLTRARERCDKTAARLARAGHETLILPLWEYRDTVAPIPEGRFDAVAFTSAAAVESLSRRIGRDAALAGLLHVAAFCVGDATAAAALDNGFTDVRNAGGDAAGLAEMLAQAGPDMTGRRLLYPAQPDRAFDLAAALPQWDVREFNAYEARQCDPGKTAFNAAVERCDVVFLYSPRGASHFVDLMVNHVTSDVLPRLTLIAISEKTARATRTGRTIDAGLDFSANNARIRILVAAKPDENAMISLLGAGKI